MPKANLYNMAGEQVGEVELSEAVFGIEPNEVVLHAAIKNHLANRRQGTQSALTKGEVSYSTHPAAEGAGREKEQRVDHEEGPPVPAAPAQLSLLLLPGAAGRVARGAQLLLGAGFAVLSHGTPPPAVR